MVRIGIAGIGFMGMIHYLAAVKACGVEVAAICSRDAKKRAGDWRGIRGNFGPAGTMMDLGRLKRYAAFSEMIADPDIDLVDICSPTDQHEAMALAALGAGKHVLVEKAISLTLEGADRMVRAAKEAGKLLMVAHVLPFFPEFAFVIQAVKKGTYGKLLGGHLKRIIAQPDWSADIADSAKTGGPAVDLHIHDTHFLGLIAGLPKAVHSSGRVNPDGTVQYVTTQYLYGPDGPALSCSSGALAMASRPFVHGFELYFEEATCVYESGAVALTLYPKKGDPEQPRLDGGDDALAAFRTEIEMAALGVASGVEPDLLSGQLARDALVLCHRECESVRTGRTIAIS